MLVEGLDQLLGRYDLPIIQCMTAHGFVHMRSSKIYNLGILAQMKRFV